MNANTVEIKVVGEKEVWINENRVFLDGNIIYDIGVGGSDGHLASAIRDAIFRFRSMITGHAGLLVDLNRATKPSVDARKIYLEITNDERLNKIALIGLHPVARVLASSLTMVTLKNNVRFFKTKEEAVLWLQD